MDNRSERRTASGGIGGKLTDKAVKAFVGKAVCGKKLADDGRLHLFITPAGGATWRVKYRIEGKEKIYSVGLDPLAGGGGYIANSRKRVFKIPIREESFLVLGIGRQQAERLGARLEQNAIVIGEVGRPALLVMCELPDEGRGASKANI